MGFFSSIAKSVSNGMQDAYETGIKTTWEKMRRLDKERLIDVCRNSDKSVIKMLAYILLSKFGNPSYMDIDNAEEILDSVKRFQKRDIVLIGEGREWNEIKEYIKRMKSDGYLED